MTYVTPSPPQDIGDWTLLQSRLQRSLWQWDRSTPEGVLSRFVILRPSDRLDYDSFDEAETLFMAMDEDDTERDRRPRLDLTSL